MTTSIEALPQEAVNACVEAATAAPSVHNTQPWLFRTDGSGIEISNGAAAAEGAALTLCDPVTRDGLLAVTRTAEQMLSRDPAYREELAWWTGREAHRHDGIPSTALGFVDSEHRLPLRDFRFDRAHAPGRRTARFERHPSLAILTTRNDACYDWVRAGQALQRVLLTATAHGLVVTPMNQALEVPALRRLIGAEGDGRHAQVILRIGYGRPGPATPRRGSTGVLADHGWAPNASHCT